jgi:hypothetical protein
MAGAHTVTNPRPETGISKRCSFEQGLPRLIAGHMSAGILVLTTLEHSLDRSGISEKR